MKTIISSIAFSFSITILSAQSPVLPDTIKAKMLDSVTVLASLRMPATAIPDVVGVNLYAGKKTNSVTIDPASGNLAQNVARTALAQIPGLTIWEMDGAGTQLNIGSRGSDPHRSIEMNMRQNGYNTNSDMFGYPENHYTAPLQGVRQVQLVRGSAALQFGSQFGGMLNLVMKDGDSSKPLSVESEQTGGSNHFFNSFNAVGGTVGKVRYYAYYDNRHGDGWRSNAAFNYQAYYASIHYQFNERGSIAFQFSRMDYRQQIAGGLDDAQMAQDARQSFRSRNFFNPEINIPALLFQYRLSANTRLEITSHALFGQRNSVQFINTPDIADTINKSLGTYNPRQVDRDYYNGFTTEARLLHVYRLGAIKSTLSGGLRYFTQTTRRRQKAVGTIGSDFDLSLVKPYGIDLRLHSNNYAAFAEDIFQLTPRFSATPGVRYEIIQSSLTGVINNASFPVAYTGNRQFPLFGLGLQYQSGSSTQLYGNMSQAYRPYIYASITPADQIGQIDPNLKDSKGYDIDLGWRGHYKNTLWFDVNAFYLFYGNRVGQLTLPGSTGNYLYTTNIGDAMSKGVEAYVSVSVPRLLGLAATTSDVRVFNSLAYDHARYINGSLSKSGINVSLAGNAVESLPEWINRAGLSYFYKALTATLQFSYSGSNFSDATNTVFNPTGATGKVPSYSVWDFTLNYNFLQHYHLSAGVNNLADARYFTRRINMYPGPGILPADGRTFYLSAGIKL